MKSICLLFSIALVACTNDPKLVQDFVSDKEQAIPKGDIEGQNFADQKKSQGIQADNGSVVSAKKIEQFLVFQYSVKWVDGPDQRVKKFIWSVS